MKLCLFLIMISAFLAERIAANPSSLVDHFRAVYDVLPQMIWITDDQGDIVFLNRCWREYVGDPELEGNAWVNALHPDDLATVSARREMAIHTRSTYDCEYRLKNKEGEYEWFLSKATVKLRSDGVVERWFGVNTNINEHKKALQREKKQNIFFGSAVHELKTPISGIIGLSELLLISENSIQIPQQREDLRNIFKCGTNVLSLITNLLDFCRLESDHLTLDHTVFSLEEQFEHIVKIARLKSAHDISYTLSPSLRDPNLLSADLMRLNQILNNLVTNAVKFTKNPGIIHISAL